MFKVFRSIVDWAGRYQTVQTIIHIEFVRTALWPTVLAVLVGGAGVVQHVPFMWIITAAALTFMAVLQALLRGDEFRERRTPENKLSYVVVFQMDLNPAEMPFHGTRQQRRGQQARRQPRATLSPTQINAQVPRTLEKGQLGIEITNNASFPISCFLERADTELEGISPPRSDFPKPKVIVASKDKVRLMDDAIELDDLPCRRLSGEIDLTIKFGLPGKERFSLHTKGKVEIVMENFGFVQAIMLDRNS